MIMRKYSFLLSFLLAITLFVSCKKESSTVGGLPPVDTSNTKQILSNLFAGTRTMTPVQSREITAGSLQVVYGNMNTRLIFYPNSFKDKNGSIITSGQIDVQFREMYAPGQVIANRSSATAFGRLLQSGGQVYIKAYRSGQEVFPTVYGIGFAVANTVASAPMALFYGNNTSGDSIVTWEQSRPNAGTIVTGAFTDTTNGAAYYQFDSCTNFNWINCDYFYNITGQELTNISLVSKDTFGLDKTNTQVFLVFPSINSVTYMQMFDPATKIWSLSQNYQVPVNMNFHAVSLSLRNGLYYYSEIKNLTVANNFVDTLRPEQKSLPDVLTALTNL